MSLFDMLLLIAAGFAAGGMNALAGGGTFIIAGRVSWSELAILLIGTTLGGYAGGALSQKLPARWLRAFVILVGASMTVYYFWTTYWR